MGAVRLDPGLLDKMVKKSGLSVQSVREGVSKRATRLGVVSAAAQILWAKELGISTTGPMQRLEPYVQEQVRSELPAVIAKGSVVATSKPRAKGAAARAPKVDTIRLAVEYLLADQELLGRCGDLLRAKGKFDRVVREATTVLDARLRTKSGVKEKLNPVPLVNKVLNPDPKKAIVVISDNGDEQEGFYSIIKGLMLAFRNPAHHGLDDKLKREDALRICGLVDALLPILDRAKVVPPAK